MLNVYASKNRTSKYIKQKLIKLQGEMDKPTNTVRGVSILLSSMGISNRQKIVELNSTTLLDAVYISRELHLTRAAYTFFLSSYETFTKIDHILDHITYLQRLEIIKHQLSDHNGIKKKSITER